MDRIDAMRLFGRLAERGSFSAAARDVKVKQSTASKWIAQLEDELGVGLVERTTRSIHLTEAGRRFLRRSSEVVALFDETAREISERRAELAGCVRLSLPVVLGRLYVVPSVVDFLRKHPKVSSELVFNDRYVNLVEEGFDLAVRVGVPSDTSARGRKLVDGRRRVVASPSYLEARGRPKIPSDLRDHDCLIHGDDASAGTIWRFGRKHAPSSLIPVRGRVAASNSEAVLELARSGLGIALLADWLVSKDLKLGRLVTLLPDYEAPPAPVYALSPPGRHAPQLVRELIDHLAKALSKRLPPAP